MSSSKYTYGKELDELATIQDRIDAGEELLEKLQKDLYSPDKLRMAFVAKALNNNNKILKGGI